jgi:hypothetical protein
LVNIGVLDEEYSFDWDSTCPELVILKKNRAT